MKKFLFWLVGGIVLLLLAGVLLPRHITGSQSADIKANPHTLTLLTSSMRQFNRWSPWHDIDPGTVYTFDGPYGGVGSAMTWSSTNSNVGKGSEKITAVDAGKSVDVRIGFEGKGGIDARFVFEPLDSRTKTTWTYDYDAGNNPVARWIGLFMKSSINKDYAKGLAKLKGIAEAAPQVDFEDFDAMIGDESAMILASISHDTPILSTQIARTLARDYAAIGAQLAKQKLSSNGAPRAVYEPVGEPGTPQSRYKIVAQMPVPGNFTAVGNIANIGVPAGSALKVVYHGAYDAMEPTYEKAFAYLKVLGLEGGPPTEVYIDDPAGKDLKDVRTDIIIPVKY
jgi:effector-binding domain-containing protein